MNGRDDPLGRFAFVGQRGDAARVAGRQLDPLRRRIDRWSRVLVQAMKGDASSGRVGGRGDLLSQEIVRVVMHFHPIERA